MDTPTLRRVHVTTLGCRLNQYDSEMLLTQLRSEGYVETPSAREADLVVVNTCAVTETAERKGRAAIRAALRQNPQTEVVATGCHAERAPEALLKSGASRILGNREKERFLEFLNLDESIQIGGIHTATGWTDGTRIAELGEPSVKESASDEIARRREARRAEAKVAQTASGSGVKRGKRSG